MSDSPMRFPPPRLLVELHTALAGRSYQVLQPARCCLSFSFLRCLGFWRLSTLNHPRPLNTFVPSPSGAAMSRRDEPYMTSNLFPIMVWV
eukprot:3822612-Rhodomonas_salina.4